MTAKKDRIAVIGAGSWGATLATLLAEKGHDVSLWEFDRLAAEALSSTRRLPVLPDLKLHPAVMVTSTIATALDDRSLVVSATPSAYVRSTMRAVKKSGALSTNAVV